MFRPVIPFVLRALPPAALLWLASCVTPHGVSMQEVDPLGWRADEPVVVAYENTDTVSRREIRTVVRVQNDFAFDRLGLQLTTVAPNGLRWRDTITVMISEFSRPGNHYSELEQPYRRNVTLTQSGRYLFTFAPIMPVPRTEGVTAVGIHVVPEN